MREWKVTLEIEGYFVVRVYVNEQPTETVTYRGTYGIASDVAKACNDAYEQGRSQGRSEGITEEMMRNDAMEE
jgi:hypothetical protein